MNTDELQHILNLVISARESSNWKDKFTPEVRQSTVEYRMHKIAGPLEQAIKKMQKELDNRSYRKQNRRTPRQAYRLPYKDN